MTTNQLCNVEKQNKRNITLTREEIALINNLRCLRNRCQTPLTIKLVISKRQLKWQQED